MIVTIYYKTMRSDKEEDSKYARVQCYGPTVNEDATYLHFCSVNNKPFCVVYIFRVSV
jgi:hypothetical protein